MKRIILFRILVILILLAVLVSCIGRGTPTQSLNPTKNIVTETVIPGPTLLNGGLNSADFQKGLNYTSWQAGEYSSSESDRTISEKIKPLGVNWLAVVVTCYQDTVNSTQIECKYDSKTPTDTDVRHVVQYAHSLGIKIMFKPHVDLWSDESHLRYQITFNNEDSWIAWFASYTLFIQHYAQLAQQLGVEYFVVGTELQGTYQRDAQWRQVIQSVRQLYRGPLTYAATPGDEVTKITWWDALDAIGVDAYYSLTQSYHPTVTELVNAWQPIIVLLGEVSGRWNRPVIFTEIGYQSLAGTNQMTSKVDTSTLDLQEQANCYQAVFEALKGKSWWRGVFWWAWDTTLDQGGPQNTGYTGKNKPVEDILRAYYGGPAVPISAPTPTVQVDLSKTFDIYNGGLSQGWQDWSWSAKVRLPLMSTVQGWQKTIRVSLLSNGALSLHTNRLDTSPYGWLEFYINPGQVLNRDLTLYLNDENDKALGQQVYLNNVIYLGGSILKENQWQRVLVPLTDLSDENRTIVRINIKDSSGNGQPDFYIDKIRLLGAK
jgi:hypothetical protein